MLSNSKSPGCRRSRTRGRTRSCASSKKSSAHDRDYVEKRTSKRCDRRLRGLTDGLDPFSAYLLAPQGKEYQHEGQGRMTGMVIGQYSGFAYVIAVIQIRPPIQAGIRGGDVIEYIDGHATATSTLRRALARYGLPGTNIEVSLINRRSDKLSK